MVRPQTLSAMIVGVSIGSPWTRRKASAMPVAAWITSSYAGSSARSVSLANPCAWQ